MGALFGALLGGLMDHADLTSLYRDNGADGLAVGQSWRHTASFSNRLRLPRGPWRDGRKAHRRVVGDKHICIPCSRYER